MNTPTDEAMERAQKVVESCNHGSGGTCRNCVALAILEAEKRVDEVWKKKIALWRATAGALHDTILDAERGTARSDKRSS